jgi:hypothetical protein
MTVGCMCRELDETLARAAASLDLARGIHIDLEATAAAPVPGWLWRCGTCRR